MRPDEERRDRPTGGGHEEPRSRRERRGRLRFAGFSLERFSDGRCRARVRTEWRSGQTFEGEAEGIQTPQGELRAAALAALEAAGGASGRRLALELRGVKAIRAFDSWVVVVSVEARATERRYRLLGAFPCPDEDTPRGAAMAVLDATNRVLQRYLRR